MKTFLIFSTFLLAWFSSYAQQYNLNENMDDISQAQNPGGSGYVSSINLTGNFNELVVVVGFPDRSYNYPTLNTNSYYPLYGAFPDGTLLKDYVAQNGGSIPADDWFEPAFNHYFNTISGGVYNVNFQFVKSSSNGGTYLSDHDFSYWIAQHGSSNSVIFYEHSIILREIADKMFNDNPSIFDNISCIHIIFIGVSNCEFFYLNSSNCAGGTINNNLVLKSVDGSKTYYTGPVSIQNKFRPMLHERLHIIGNISDLSGFKGFPDRGYDKSRGENHHNMFPAYDIMYHSGDNISPLHSLYGYHPMLSSDLIFLGWIKPNEIEIINSTNFINYSDIKLKDVAYPLTTQDINNGYRRIVKAMIKENFNGNRDEYFLVEFHNGSEFDKAFENYDEYPTGGFNTGILIWHIKETVDMINTGSDNLIDLEAAIPYNGWNGNPIPDDNYPRNYTRTPNYNGIHSSEFDWLDDALKNTALTPDKYYFMPDGGRHIWETTVTTAVNDFSWDPTGQNWFFRLQSEKSDFFSDDIVKGHVSDKITDATRPSTKTWGGFYNVFEDPEKTHIAITNIKKENGYMTIRIYYNYWEGTYTSDQTMSSNVTIGGDVSIASGSTLTIQPGTNITFKNSSSLVVNGTLNVQGTSSNPVTFDLISPDATAKNGIKLNGSGSLSISHAIIKNAYNGISIITPVSGSPSIENTEIKNCYNGIVIQYGNKDADITIADNNIHDNTNYGISISNPDHFGMNFEPSTSDNTITNCNYGIYLNEANVDISSSEVSDCIYGLYLYRTNYANGQPTITDVHSYDNSTSGISLYYSSPKILDSEFDNAHYGVYCNSYSSPELGYAGTYGNNNIHNNFYGLYTFSNPNPFLGRQTCTIQGGNNKIAYNGPYNARILSNSTVIAEQNYWGANPPQSSLIYADGTSSIDYTPWLVSSPFKLVPNRNQSPEEYVFNKSFGNSANSGGYAASSVDTSKPNSFDPKWPLFWKILYIRNLVDVGKYKFAQEICKDIINEYPDSSLSFYALDLLWKASQNDEDSFKSYLTAIKNKKIVKNLYGSAEIILSGFENSSRISSLDNLASQYSSRSVGEAALFSKFLYYINEQKNIEMAREVSKELDDKFPDSPAAIDAHLQLGGKVKDIIISKSGNVEKLLSEDNMPKEYTLLGNYPNPFNPSTKIRYMLPFNSNVEITIYNIAGQIVKAFKYGSQSAGIYDVKWDGTNSNNEQVSSGIYLYHFKAVSLQKNNEVFEKSAKLILMK